MGSLREGENVPVISPSFIVVPYIAAPAAGQKNARAADPTAQARASFSKGRQSRCRQVPRRPPTYLSYPLRKNVGRHHSDTLAGIFTPFRLFFAQREKQAVCRYSIVREIFRSKVYMGIAASPCTALLCRPHGILQPTRGEGPAAIRERGIRSSPYLPCQGGTRRNGGIGRGGSLPRGGTGEGILCVGGTQRGGLQERMKNCQFMFAMWGIHRSHQKKPVCERDPGNKKSPVQPIRPYRRYTSHKSRKDGGPGVGRCQTDSQRI